MEILRNLFSAPPLKNNLSWPTTARSLSRIYDIFYVCFDEPNRGENWLQVKSVFPKAHKVEGVIGFDRALKTCARKSKTSHFFVIDGDNRVLAERLDREIPLQAIQSDWVLSWSSRNPLNGLIYGNGGLKLWPKEVALNIKTHEASEGDQDPTDYCFVASYYLVDDYLSETFINTTPIQAFRAGFREGVKMSLSLGRQIPLDYDNFDEVINNKNKERLKAWCEVGADQSNGYWAILGARLGLINNAIDQFPYEKINSFQWIDSQLKDYVMEHLGIISFEELHSADVTQKLMELIASLGAIINDRLPMDLKLMSIEESLAFKATFQNPGRQGLLAPKPARP
jgi:hypothetical protein